MGVRVQLAECLPGVQETLGLVPGMNPSTQELQPGGPGVCGYSRLHAEFEAPWDT